MVDFFNSFHVGKYTSPMDPTRYSDLVGFLKQFSTNPFEKYEPSKMGGSESSLDFGGEH